MFQKLLVRSHNKETIIILIAQNQFVYYSTVVKVLEWECLQELEWWAVSIITIVIISYYLFVLLVFIS